MSKGAIKVTRDGGVTWEIIDTIKGEPGPQGPQGTKGDKGGQGIQGIQGDQGYSAYEVWLQQPGNAGKTESDFIDYLKYNVGPTTWSELRNVIRDGTVTNYFSVGDIFTINRGAETLLAVLADVGSVSKNITANGNAPTDPNYFTNFPNAKPLTLEFLEVANNIMFSAPQANYEIVTEIASGTACNIALKTKNIAGGALVNYDFTAPQALAVGGRLRQSTAASLLYYATPKSSPVEITLTAGSVNASISEKLSLQNDFNRATYGNNNYLDSAIRQYLESSAAAGTYWNPKTIYDMPPSWNATLDGFQLGMDPDFLAIVGKTTREIELNTITDGGGNSSMTDKIFLPSRKEIYGDAENLGHKGRQFDIYVDTTNAAKVKYDITAPQTPLFWWLRSPYAGYSSGARVVGSGGSVGYSLADVGGGVAPACVIL